MVSSNKLNNGGASDSEYAKDLPMDVFAAREVTSLGRPYESRDQEERQDLGGRWLRISDSTGVIVYAEMCSKTSAVLGAVRWWHAAGGGEMGVRLVLGQGPAGCIKG